jgi:hypothetical protein
MNPTGDARTTKTSRSRSPSSSSHGSVSPHNPRKRMRVSVAPGTIVTTPSSSKPATKKASKNPIEELLKDKKMSVKHGTSLKGARANLSSGSAQKDWTDEQAALAAVRRVPDLGYDDDFDMDGDGNTDGPEDGVLDEELRAKLLGDERGKVVGEILVKDKEGKEKEKIVKHEKVAGVKLWFDGGLDNSEREWAVPFEFAGECKALELLKDAVQRGGMSI